MLFYLTFLRDLNLHILGLEISHYFILIVLAPADLCDSLLYSVSLYDKLDVLTLTNAQVNFIQKC